VGVFVNTITVEQFEISSMLQQQDIVKSSEDFENVCIPVHCDARVMNFNILMIVITLDVDLNSP